MVTKINIFDRNKKKLETFIHTFRIFNHEVGKSFGIEKYTNAGNEQQEREKRQTELSFIGISARITNRPRTN